MKRGNAVTQTDPFATQNDSKTADPFGQADGSTGDPFGGAPERPEGNFIKSSQLKPNGITGATDGALVMLKVTSAVFEMVEKPAEYGGKPGDLQERMSVDTAVLDGEHAGHAQEGMWWFNGAVNRDVKRFIAKNPATMLMLGRVSIVPSKLETGAAKKLGDEFAGYARTKDELPEAYAAYRNGKRPKEPNIAVIISEYTPDDAVKAREFLAAHPEFLR